MQANSSSGSLHKTKSARARLAESAWPVGREKRVHVYGIVSRETRDSTNINFTIARRRGAIVDLQSCRYSTCTQYMRV